MFYMLDDAISIMENNVFKYKPHSFISNNF